MEQVTSSVFTVPVKLEKPHTAIKSWLYCPNWQNTLFMSQLRYQVRLPAQVKQESGEV